MNIRLLKHVIMIIGAVAMIVLMPSTRAADITWTIHDITGRRTDVVTNGTLVAARSCHSTDNKTVNGVIFLARNNSTNLFTSLWRWDNIAGRAGQPSGGSWQDDYYSFMTLVESSGDTIAGDQYAYEVACTTDWAEIEMTNLTVGNTYHVQIWRTDTDQTVGNARDSGLLLPSATGSADPSFSADRIILRETADNINLTTYGYSGQYGVGVFVADAATEMLSIRNYSGLLTTPSPSTTRHPCNGFQLRDLGADTTAPSPAPTIATLIPNETRIEVQASTNTRDQTSVEYRFVRREGLGGPAVFTSNWQAASVYTDTGLVFETEYSYTVQARDKVPAAYGGPYMTAESAEVATTTLAVDTTPPTPATMSFSSPPSAVDLRTITMTAVEAIDPRGVEYRFVRRLGIGGPVELTSEWQDSRAFTDTGLNAGTTYSYTVQARDKAEAGNTNTVSSESATATHPRGTATITWVISNITDNVSEILTNGVLVDARNGSPTASATVNGVLFDTANNAGDLMENVTNNDNIGSRGYGSVVTDSGYRTMLQTGQRATGIPNPWTSIEFLGLQRGSTYQIQIWVSDVAVGGTAPLDTAMVLGDGSTNDPVRTADTTVYWEATDGGAGQYAIGSFVANAPNQSFALRKYTSLLTTPTAGSNGHFCNGWQIRLTYTPPAGTLIVIQ